MNEGLNGEIESFKNELNKKYDDSGAKKQRNILIVVILLLLAGAVFGYQKYQNLRVDLNIAEQNEKALSDSVRVEKNKVGDIEFSKNILVAKNNELESLSKDLADEVKKEKGKVRQLTKYVASISNDNQVITINNTLTKFPDGVKGLDWKFEKIYDDENSRFIEGTSKFKIDTITGKIKPLETLITRDDINFNIIQGLREKDGNVEMFVRSDYPGFGVNDLQSAIIDPQKHPVLSKFTKNKKWSVGPSVTVGLGVNTWPAPNVGFGVMVGVSVQRTLFRF